MSAAFIPGRAIPSSQRQACRDAIGDPAGTAKLGPPNIGEIAVLARGVVNRVRCAVSLQVRGFDQYGGNVSS